MLVQPSNESYKKINIYYYLKMRKTDEKLSNLQN